jgi:hypothetical protein
MKKKFKLRYVIIPAVLLGILAYVAYIFLHYFNYMEYRKYLTDCSYEEGREFAALQDADPKVQGMVLAAESEYLKLYTNLKTTEVAVYDKRSGEITYSNPVDRSADGIATGRNKTALNSQFMLTYYDLSMTMVNMYNYDYSVERGQFTLEALENGIRYNYLLGNMDSPTGLVPPIITEERLQEKILSKLSEKEAKTIRKNYIESKTVEGFLELTDGAKAYTIGLQKWNELVKKAGYTQEDFDEDAVAAAGGSLPERTTFTIPLEYRLEEDTLRVSIPTEKIRETGSGRLANIDLLCYFGAGGMEEEGYILVPNGTGSLIYFNNGKKNDKYNQYVYGMDETIQSATVVEETEKVRIPVFGIKHAKSAVFAEITVGDTLANIMAAVSGGVNSYNYVYPSFVLRGSEKVSMFGAEGEAADLPVLEKEMYKLNLTVNYSFLNGEEASYSGMANYYRQRLMDRGILSRKEEQASIPFYLDLLGGVKLEESVLAVSYLDVYPMTSFEEAELILNAFRDRGIFNLRVNYLGWFNEGYYHDTFHKLKVDKELGGKKKLERLNQSLKEAGIRLYGDVAIQRVSFEAEDHYNWKMENSRYYNGYAVAFGRVNPAYLRVGPMGYYESMYNVLSPKFLVRHVDQFLKRIKKVDISGISLRDMGDMVASDKRRSNVINREQAKQVIIGQLERIDAARDYLMINGGNAYSWAYADDLQNIPASHNPFYVVDEEIPFYQMVIHGCIDYSSTAINLSDSYDKQDIILRSIEFGMAPHFTLSYESSSKIKYSGLNHLYSTQYEIWLQDATDIYRKTNEALQFVTGSTITDHRSIRDGVKRIAYGNGVEIYVNYTTEAVKLSDITVPARGYALKGVEE